MGGKTSTECQDFLEAETELDSAIVAYLLDAMQMQTLSDFADRWTEGDAEDGLRDDVVAQVEPFKSDMSNTASRLQVARLHSAWLRARKGAAPARPGEREREARPGQEVRGGAAGWSWFGCCGARAASSGDLAEEEGEEIRFTYFNVEGGGECVRLAFALGNVDYVDDRIDMAKSWKELKPQIKFGQLPVLTLGGGEQISQVGAHLRYAGKRAGLIPERSVEMMKVEEVIGLSGDLVTAIAPSMQLDRRPHLYGYDGVPQEQLTKIASDLRDKLSAEDGDINRFLGFLDKLLAVNGTGWFVGKRPTIAECEVVPRLRALRKGNRARFPKEIVDKFANLMKMYYAFHELPAIKAHYRGVPPF